MDKEQLLKLADLARIEISHEELQELKKDFDVILEYVSQIQEIPTFPKGQGRPEHLFNVFREDANSHEARMYSERLLSAAPRREGDYVKVKKILG